MKRFTFVVMLLFIVFLYGCNPANKKLANKMLEKYSNEQNYVELSGMILEYDENSVIIKCEGLKLYIPYEDEICDYYIYSQETLDLNVGDIINFVTVPFHFYNGHKLPIVELEINGNTLLTFEEGKNNLIEWVNTSFN